LRKPDFYRDGNGNLILNTDSITEYHRVHGSMKYNPAQTRINSGEYEALWLTTVPQADPPITEPQRRGATATNSDDVTFIRFTEIEGIDYPWIDYEGGQYSWDELGEIVEVTE
jgi:hypothetical protein